MPTDNLKSVADLVWLPIASMDNLAEVPGRSGIYFMMHGGDLVYIGTASHLRTRLNSWKFFKDMGCRVHWIIRECGRFEEENRLIALFSPEYNGKPKGIKQQNFFPETRWGNESH